MSRTDDSCKDCKDELRVPLDFLFHGETVPYKHASRKIEALRGDYAFCWFYQQSDNGRTKSVLRGNQNQGQQMHLEHLQVYQDQSQVALVSGDQFRRLVSSKFLTRAGEHL